jgi:hypothetical protein
MDQDVQVLHQLARSDAIFRLQFLLVSDHPTYSEEESKSASNTFLRADSDFSAMELTQLTRNH